MKIVKNVKMRTVTLANVKKGQECFIEGDMVIKVAPKTVMTKTGERIGLTDATLAKIKL